jgi:predicted membrane channel-forming protein YqfA (hemolysin III family)
MDYRYYRGEGPKLPAKWGKHLHKLRHVGTGMLLIGVILPWLMVIKVLESTFFWNFLAYGLTFFGVILYIIGFVYNSFFDRAD